MLDANGLLGIIEKICLSNDISKYYALQGFVAQKRLFNFKQVNGMSLVGDKYHHTVFEMLARVAYKKNMFIYQVMF